MENNNYNNNINEDWKDQLGSHEFDYDRNAEQQFISEFGDEGIQPDRPFWLLVRDYFPLMVLLLMVIIGFGLWWSGCSGNSGPSKISKNSLVEVDLQTNNNREKQGTIKQIENIEASTDVNESVKSKVDKSAIRSSNEKETSTKVSNVKTQELVTGSDEIKETKRIRNQKFDKSIIKSKASPNIRLNDPKNQAVDKSSLKNNVQPKNIIAGKGSTLKSYENIENVADAIIANADGIITNLLSPINRIEQADVPNLRYFRALPNLVFNEEFQTFDKKIKPSPWSFGIEYSWMYGQLEHKNESCIIDDFSAAQDTEIIPGRAIAWSIGLGTSYQLTNRWQLYSGLRFLSSTFSAYVLSQNEPTIELGDNSIRSKETIEWKTTEIGLPLGCRYFFKETNAKWNFYQDIGFQYQYAINSIVFTDGPYATNSNAFKQIEDADIESNCSYLLGFNSSPLTFETGLGMKYTSAHLGSFDIKLNLAVRERIFSLPEYREFVGSKLWYGLSLGYYL